MYFTFSCADSMYVSLQINLSYCSVTDIGLLSLSSICGLQNMTIVHLAGITPNGLTAALMVCGGLTKVKLHEAFKSMMPPHMLKNVEARGCMFQWINKPFKVLCFCLSCLPLHYVESSITLAFLLWIIVFGHTPNLGKTLVL